MAATLALVSDTHVPTRAGEIPGWVRERIRAADHTIHAGDFDSLDALAEVRELADGNLTAVRGNVDPPDLDLPAAATVEFEGATFVVTHGSGSSRGYEERIVSVVREEAGPGVVGVSGHTHEVLNAVLGEVRLLNPGSATGARPATEATMMTAEVDDGDVDVTVRRE